MRLRGGGGLKFRALSRYWCSVSRTLKAGTMRLRGGGGNLNFKPCHDIGGEYQELEGGELISSPVEILVGMYQDLIK